MGSPVPAVLLLALLILRNFTVSAPTSFPYLLQRGPRCRLAANTDESFIESPRQPRSALTLRLGQRCPLAWRCPPCLHIRLVLDTSGFWSFQGVELYFLVLKSNVSHKLHFSWRNRTPVAGQWKVLCDCCLGPQGHHIAISLSTSSSSGLRLKRTHFITPQMVKETFPQDMRGLQLAESSKHVGPEFSFVLLPKERVVQVSIPPGPRVSVRLCHQLQLECEELSRPFHQQEIVPGGQTVKLPYEFLLPCLCIEAAYLQQDSVRRKECPFRNHPGVYGTDFWQSVEFADHSKQDQMVMALTLRCPVKPKASLCQRQSTSSPVPCEDLSNATVSESEGWYTLEKVDLHPQLCFKFSLDNSSHVECPHRSAPSWNTSADTWSQQLVLHFVSRMPAAFSAALCHPGIEFCELQPPIYTVSQPRGTNQVESELTVPLQSPGSCVLVWRSDVLFSHRQLLCPDVSHRHFGLVALGLLMGAALMGTILMVNGCGLRRPLTGPHQPRPVLLLYSADSAAQRRLVCALAELLREALGCDVILDLWEGARLAHVGPLPWLCGARMRVAQEQGTVLLLWSRGSHRLYRLWQADALDSARQVTQDPHDLFRAALSCLQREFGGGVGPPDPPAAILAYFGRLCSKRDIPQPLRMLRRYRLLRDLPGLLRALRTQPASAGDPDPDPDTSCWLRTALRLRAQRSLGSERSHHHLRGRLELCRQLQREAARPDPTLG
ncbi:interleukin-17 receptor E [Ornithorhynchus anatinus]|uniref:Interleukin 17 receptor E n=1 Tax=Ornithorhynchus anatinus TaxID=9258 RepID=F7DWV9_ORNAN|nr:interleukin-17 receptor E [Ornithorhynchus anatinus]